MKFLLWREGDIKAHAVRAEGRDACEAAELWARHHDFATADFAIAGKGQAARVHLVSAADPDGAEWRVEVTGHAEPVYEARLLGGRAAEQACADGGKKP